jgi:hypothetical protein
MINDQLKNPTKLYANWMGWFTKTGGKHLNTVCQSDDPETVRKQVKMAQALGLDGFVVDWYGNDDQPSAEATKILAEICRYENFEFSIMLDSGLFKWKAADTPTRTQILQDAVNWVMANYATLPNYSKINGRPLLWEFGWRGNGIVVLPQMGNALLLSQDSSMGADDATFAWVRVPDNGGAYLKSYLAKSTAIQVPAIWWQFDDHDPKNPALSIWSPPTPTPTNPAQPARFIDHLYGETFISCIEAINATGKTYPAVQIVTWNDYEERTCMEPLAKALTGTRL